MLYIPDADEETWEGVARKGGIHESDDTFCNVFGKELDLAGAGKESGDEDEWKALCFFVEGMYETRLDYGQVIWKAYPGSTYNFRSVSWK